MRGIILLVSTGALVFVVSRLLSFVKALQTIQYVLGIHWSTQFYLVQQVPSWKAPSLFNNQPFQCCSTRNPLAYFGEEHIIHEEIST